MNPSAVPSIASQRIGAGTVPNLIKGSPSAWLDYGTITVPDSHAMVLWWSQYLWTMDGTYRSAMERVCAHFMTQVELPDLEPDEESQWKDLFQEQLNYRSDILGLGHEFLCFHGDTLAITESGPAKLRDLEGRTVNVLSQGGVYRPAEFKRFGRQELLEVEFSDGRKVLATPEHQWIVAKSTGGTIRVPTIRLAGRSIERTVAARPQRGEEFRDGVRNGFVFGDGTLYNKHRKIAYSMAYFYGKKDEAILPFFAGIGHAPRRCKTRDCWWIQGLPARYKSLPPVDASPEYWYGFVCGFLAADGSVDTYGCAILTQRSKAAVEAIVAQLPRIGMVAGPVRGHYQESALPEYKGKSRISKGTQHYVTLLKQFMRPEDFLIKAHRENFEREYSASPYGRFIKVKSVNATGLYDDVFCCVEHETHSFVLENGVLTGNCYGNAFASLYFPFRRHVRCKQCVLDQPIEEVDFRLEFVHVEPYVKWARVHRCPRCGNTEPYEIVDRRDPDLDRMRIVKYCPEDMELAQNRWSGKKEFWYKIPEDERREIQNSSRIHIETTPLEVLQAVAVNGKLKFDEDQMFHAAESTLSGLRANGWGIPRAIASFRAAWLQQLVNKTDQAVALDYTLGMRVLSPTPTPGGTDPMQTQGMEVFASRVQNMVQKHRNEPASYHTSPYPLQYQFMGGEGANLVPPEKLKFRQQEFLNQLGVPLEYQNMSLTTQGAPMALRLFESYWQGIPSMYNNVLNWIVSSVSKAYNLPATKARMQRSTLADDAEYRQIVLQLMSANQLSPQTALQAYNIDAYQEAQKALKHQALVQKLQADFDEKALQQQEMGALKGMASNPTPSMLAQQQQAQAGGGMAPPPGAPMGGVPTGGMPGSQQQSPQSLTQLSGQAQTIAQQLVSMPEYDRKQQLKALRESNKDMHSLVMGFMEEYRRQAASQGQQMLLQPPTAQ